MGLNNIRRIKNITAAQLHIHQLFPHRIATVVKYDDTKTLSPGTVLDLSTIMSRADSEVADKLQASLNSGMIQAVETGLGTKDAYYPGASIAAFQASIQQNLVAGALSLGPASAITGINVASPAVPGVNLVPVTVQLIDASVDVFPYDDNIGAKLTLSGTAVTKSIVSVNGLPYVVGTIYYFKSGLLNLVVSATNPVALQTLIVTPDPGWDAQLVPVTAALAPTAATVTF